VLNPRQAGAAIEGAMRQRHVELEKLAVDTHGFTHFALAMANLLGFGLCPRLDKVGRQTSAARLDEPMARKRPALCSRQSLSVRQTLDDEVE
jgi:TnpA family transposase